MQVFILITHKFWWNVISSSLSLFPSSNSLKPHDKWWPHPDEARSFSGWAPAAAVPSQPPCPHVGCSVHLPPPRPPSEFLTWTSLVPVSQNSSQKLRSTISSLTASLKIIFPKSNHSVFFLRAITIPARQSSFYFSCLLDMILLHDRIYS